jgi:hypothetical protein
MPARIRMTIGTARRVLQEGSRDGMVLRRSRADDNDAVAVLGRREWRKSPRRSSASMSAATEDAWHSRVQ